MRPETRRHIHLGINYIMVPSPLVEQGSALAFQQALIQRSLGFDRVEYEENAVRVIRERLPLQIVVRSSTGQPTGQLLILAPQPERNVEYFCQEAEFVVTAFESVWPDNQRQIVKRDVTIRDLYETDQHAFQEIWEARLGQAEDSLAAFGRKVLGGGMRFVMPPQPDRPAQVEVKIESYLRDTTRIFAECQFTWVTPGAPNATFAPREHLSEVDAYARKQVIDFMQGER